MILDTFPTPAEFYQKYWGKKPFIVRGYIPSAVIDTLVDGDTLAGLALEDDIKSRFITNEENGKGWKCQHGPLDESQFEDLPKRNWSVMVQNVEQYHYDTAQLLTYFQFSPRWLLDDVMVSFSAPGGSVGPHTDSYHTFLVQGIGKRTWKISDKPIFDDRYAGNPDMKILEHGFDGETFEVTAGDVIYMPPFFGHEGKTLDAAMTFSVGFLGPKLSEMLGDYAQYIEENESLNTRFLGDVLGEDSAGFSIASTTKEAIQNDIIQTVQSDHFANWMASYFAMPSHHDIDDEEREMDDMTVDELLADLNDGDALCRPEHIKMVITPATVGGYYLSALGYTMPVPDTQSQLIEALNNSTVITLDMINQWNDKDGALACLVQVYNNGIIDFVSTCQ